MKSVYRTRLANLTALVLGNNVRTWPALPMPFFAIHIPGLEETLPDAIEQARLQGRAVRHVRFVRVGGEACLKLQQEEAPHVRWSRPEDAPQTTETTIKLDGSRSTEQAPARYGAGCRVPNEGE